MIRSFALSGAEGRVFVPRSPFAFFGLVDAAVATAYCGGSE
jgi:predicted aconitase with swiveling domain